MTLPIQDYMIQLILSVNVTEMAQIIRDNTSRNHNLSFEADTK